MNGDYAEYIETEVLPRVEKNCKVKLTKDPDGRAAMGNSSGGSAALIMAWFRNDLYHRVLTTSGTFVNQAWPFDPEVPRRGLGLPRDAHPQEPEEADPHFHLRRRRGSAQPQRDARRHARLGGGQPPHGQGAEGQGLRVPVPVLPRGRPRRRQRPGAVPPARHRMGVEGVRGEEVGGQRGHAMSKQWAAILIGGLLPAVFLGISGAVQKTASRTGITPGLYLLIIGLVVALVGAAVGARPARCVSLCVRRIQTVGFAILWSVGILGIMLGLGRFEGQVSVLVPLYNMNTLVAVGIGLVLLGEWRDVSVWRLLAGTALIVAGGVLAGTSVK